MIILYDKAQCPFCWRVRMSLHRLGLAFERRAHDDPEWSSVWPALTHMGTVPVVEDGELRLTDSRTILEYLDEAYGGLWPSGARARARAREIVVYADGVLGPAARDLIFERRDKPVQEQGQQLIDDAIGRWRAALPALADMLDESAWFAGDCSIADFAVATRFGLAYAYGMPRDGVADILGDWVQAVFARDEVMATAPDLVRDRLQQGL